MKKLVLFFLVFPAAGFASDVHLNYISRALSCMELQQILKHDGELTLVGPFGGETEYYASSSACNAFEQPTPAYEKSKDKSLCFVGYRCDPIPF